MAGWGPLARWVLRVVGAWALRRLLHRRRPRRPAPAEGEVIEVDVLGAFDRLTESSRRIVVRAASHHDGRAVTLAALLLAVLEHPASAESLEATGLHVAPLRQRLSRSVGSEDARATPPEVGDVLAAAEARADRRGAFDVTPRDLLGALAERTGDLTALLDARTAAALRAAVP